MPKVIAWCGANWWLVSVGLYVAINVLNAASRHWSEKTGAVRVLLFVAEALSIVSSSGRTPALKPPLDVDRHGPVALLLVGLAAAALLSGCCSTSRCYVARGLTAITAADKLAQKAIDEICTPKIAACGRVPKAQCAAYLQCTTGATAYQAAMDAIGQSLATVNRTLETLGVK